MDLTRPEPPALPPGVLARHQPWYRRAWDLLVRYRWEALPYYAATAHGCTVEAYAYLDQPGAGTIAAFAVTSGAAGILAAVSARLGWEKSAVISTGLTAAMGWTGWQLADPSPGAGLIMMGPLATAAGIPYWRLLAKERVKQIERDHDVQMAKLDIMREAVKAHGRIPGQRPKPEIETLAEHDQPGRVPGQMPVVPWPGVPDGLSINDPIKLSDNTEVTLPGVHVLVAGGTDMGKSGVLHIICCNVIARRDAQLYVIDMKPNAVELGIYRLAGARVASTPDEALAVLRHISAEARRRSRLMGAVVHDDGSITHRTTWKPTEDEPQMVLVIDELAELTAACPEAEKELRSHTRLLRAFGATTIAGSQVTSANTMGGNTDARGQFGLRIGLRMFETGQINMTFGQGALRAGVRPDLLRAPGEFLIVGRGGHDGLSPDRAYLMAGNVADHVRKHATGDVVMPQETEPEAFPAKPGRIDNATELITDYLREHGWSTAEDVTRGLGHYPDKLKSFRNLLRRHADNGMYKRDKTGTRYAVNERETLTGTVVRFPGRRNA